MVVKSLLCLCKSGDQTYRPARKNSITENVTDEKIAKELPVTRLLVKVKILESVSKLLQ